MSDYKINYTDDKGNERCHEHNGSEQTATDWGRDLGGRSGGDAKAGKGATVVEKRTGKVVSTHGSHQKRPRK